MEKQLESIWPDIFSAMDANSDGEITPDEIAKATANVYEPIGLWLKSTGADGVDANSDGVISKDEWKEARQKMTKEFGAPSPMAIDNLREFVRGRATGQNKYSVSVSAGTISRVLDGSEAL